MKPDNATLFIGGCTGTTTPPSLLITSPFDKREPVIAPFPRGAFGSHTTSFGLVFGEEGWFIDNGTGITHVASYLSARKVTTVYGSESHKHADHRMGIQMNMLLFRKGLVKGLYTPRLGKHSSKEAMANDFQTDIWPISPKKLGIEHIFIEFEPGDALPAFGTVDTMPLPHPGGAVAYRFSFPHGKVVIATDAELSGDLVSRYAAFVSGAKYLYVDMQYRDSEYKGEKGICGGPAMSRISWGHSTPSLIRDALTRCEKMPENIIVGHHEPMRTDEDLCLFEAEVKKCFEDLPVTIVFAREGDTFEI
jgi:phosphoribosyl 1,2-cyclic phosphodiesterase